MRRTDFPIFILTIVLTLFGIVMVYNASSISAFRDFGDQYHFVRDQILWATIGLAILFVFSAVDYHFWERLALPLLVVTIVLLVAVLIPGIGTKALGASRWLDFKLFVLQPTEFAKISLSIYLAAWLSNKERGRLWAFLLLLGVFLGLVILQPDMGTAIILVTTSLSIYFLSGANIFHFLVIFPLFFILGVLFVKLAPYRMARILTFFDPLRDPQGASYHIQQILIALGSGGLLGLGLGQSRQKYEYLPESTTDSIFAIIGEEVGFIGSFILISLFLVLIYKIYRITYLTQDRFARLLSAGIFAFFNLQVIINLAGMVNLIPLTGVPLPFISYGGSNILVAFALMGIIISISRRLKVI